MNQIKTDTPKTITVQKICYIQTALMPAMQVELYVYYDEALATAELNENEKIYYSIELNGKFNYHDKAFTSKKDFESWFNLQISKCKKEGTKVNILPSKI